MPHYDYECDACEHVFEVFQGMNDPLIEKCPECGGTVRRLIGAGSGLIFKGSGFYITDYKNGKKADTGIKSSASQKDEISKSAEKDKTEKKAPEKTVKQSDSKK